MNSLLKILRDEKDWVRTKARKYESLYSSGMEVVFDGCDCFWFKFKLTETGIQNVDGIMQYVFAVSWELFLKYRYPVCHLCQICRPCNDYLTHKNGIDTKNLCMCQN